MGLENHGNALEHSAYDNSALTHRDLTAQHIKQRAAWGTGTLGDPPTQPDVANYIWMTEVCMRLPAENPAARLHGVAPVKNEK